MLSDVAMREIRFDDDRWYVLQKLNEKIGKLSNEETLLADYMLLDVPNTVRTFPPLTEEPIQKLPTGEHELEILDWLWLIGAIKPTQDLQQLECFYDLPDRLAKFGIQINRDKFEEIYSAYEETFSRLIIKTAEQGVSLWETLQAFPPVSFDTERLVLQCGANRSKFSKTQGTKIFEVLWKNKRVIDHKGKVIRKGHFFNYSVGGAGRSLSNSQEIDDVENVYTGILSHDLDGTLLPISALASVTGSAIEGLDEKQVRDAVQQLRKKLSKLGCPLEIRADNGYLMELQQFIIS